MGIVYMKTPKILTFDEWCEEFDPIKNEDGDVCLFETFGEDLTIVESKPKNTIWTLIDYDQHDQPVIISGKHFVNRIGYYIAQKTFDKNQQDNYIVME